MTPALKEALTAKPKRKSISDQLIGIDYAKVPSTQVIVGNDGTVTRQSKPSIVGPDGTVYRSRWELEFWTLRTAEPEAGTLYYEEVRLRLARRAWYTPDFLEVGQGKPIFWEVKGFWREAARVRIKVAASKFRDCRFIAVGKRKKKDGGGWWFEELKP